MLSVSEKFLALEVEGSDSNEHRVIALCTQELKDGAPSGNLSVMVEWEWGEREILKWVLSKGLFETTFDFVPVGFNLKFDLAFLMARLEHLGLRKWESWEVRHFFAAKPMIDLSTSLVLMNASKFADSSVRNYMPGQRHADSVQDWYRQGNYRGIVDTMLEEARFGLALYGGLRKTLSNMGQSIRPKA